MWRTEGGVDNNKGRQESSKEFYTCMRKFPNATKKKTSREENVEFVEHFATAGRQMNQMCNRLRKYAQTVWQCARSQQQRLEAATEQASKQTNKHTH